MTDKDKERIRNLITERDLVLMDFYGDIARNHQWAAFVVHAIATYVQVLQTADEQQRKHLVPTEGPMGVNMGEWMATAAEVYDHLETMCDDQMNKVILKSIEEMQRKNRKN